MVKMILLIRRNNQSLTTIILVLYIHIFTSPFHQYYQKSRVKWPIVVDGFHQRDYTNYHQYQPHSRHTFKSAINNDNHFDVETKNESINDTETKIIRDTTDEQIVHPIRKQVSSTTPNSFNNNNKNYVPENSHHPSLSSASNPKSSSTLIQSQKSVVISDETLIVNDKQSVANNNDNFDRDRDKGLSMTTTTSTSTTTTVSPVNRANISAKRFCDRLSQTKYQNNEMDCVDISSCGWVRSGQSNAPDDAIRRLSCALKSDGSLKICCIIGWDSEARSSDNLPRPETDEGATAHSSRDNIGDRDQVRSDIDIKLTGRTNTTLNANTGEVQSYLDTQASVVNKKPKEYAHFIKDCGRRPGDQSRIIGGDIAAAKAWPWFALIFMQRRPNGRKIPECGAALISDRFLITAAHCVVEPGTRTALRKTIKIYARLGDSNLKVINEDELEVLVKRAIPHPEFNPNTFKNDIALLELSKKVNFTDAIGPACLPHDDPKLAHPNPGAVDERTAWVIGFGQTSYNGRTSDQLREASLKIVRHDSCKKSFQHLVRLTREYVCATWQPAITDQAAASSSIIITDGDQESQASKKPAIKDSCQGDSGGPLLMQALDSDPSSPWYIYGIVSFGYKCATAGFPGIYTRVNLYLDWIESILDQAAAAAAAPAV